ncbi:MULTISPECIES: flagellar hook protein FlgE [Clostridium]|uniref:flagellar hook protein FlgE n=1 Tax=Clostridium TaxID=1485 RepID=UPI0018AC0D8A|nr:MULTISPECIES: flagellar hook-basal body complex protein [Clostridium]MBZ0312920.1 flagellar hook-basal body complex protein [Clostridium butyricum]MDB2154380.1 flagellar hook-basal body complex protein [Clostridium butyricum]MDI9207652.1 flagellar hook-basal body complex protein [Clostridium butyricum]MDU0322781.1 flagellar hook-basal body complex protein [Clostridium butyricum]MDU1115608.1 flagellar hook-basal body complex protein [Clostridium sp.]
MLRCMYSGISGMKVNQQKLDVIGNNIANVGTTAFKSSRAEFSDMLYQNAGVATSPTANKGGTNAKQVGLGAKLASIDKVMSQGNALSTGRTLDGCIDGEGYFVVGSGTVNYGTGGTTLDTNMGISGGNMSINYTRDGNFQLDYEGNLVTSDGYRVMGYLVTSKVYDKDGNEVKDGAPASGASSIATTDADPVKEGDCVFVNADGVIKAADDKKLQPLKIPDSVYVPEYTDADGNKIDASWQKVSSFTIGKDGVITAVLANGSRTALGQVAMASFKNPAGLTAVGGNLYEVSANSGPVLVKTSVNIDKKEDGTAADTNLDNSKGFGDYIQGCLEASNVDLTEQFTDMITATRSFQAASKMITTGDEILQTITGLMR